MSAYVKRNSQRSAASRVPTTVRHYSAGAVVFRAGLVLVLQKANRQWVFPKGHVEPDEKPEQTAEREVLEESGVAVRVGTYLGTTAFSFWRPDRQELHRKRVDWYRADWIQGSPRPEPGIFQAARFAHPAEVERLLTFKEDRQILAASLQLSAG